MDFGSRGKGKVNIYVFYSHNKLQIMLIKNKKFLWKRKTTAFWQKTRQNTALWQNHGIHGIWRKSRFPWLSTVPTDNPLACWSYSLLSPVHTGDYSRWFQQQFVAEFGDSRRFWRIRRQQSPVWTGYLATVAVFGDSRRIWRLRQCGQAIWR